MGIEIDPESSQAWVNARKAENAKWRRKNGRVVVTQGIPSKPNAKFPKRKKVWR